MSIYSGFATRHQEQTYDSLLFDLFQILQRRIIKFYTAEQADQHKFHTILANLHHHLTKLEQSKYLQPKFAPAFKQLLNVTSTVNQTYLDLQQHIEAQSHQAKHVKDSLSFSRDRMSEDLKGFESGKIRHQFFGKDQFSSRKDSNPEEHPNFQRNVPRAQSTNFPRNFRSRKQFQKKGCHHDSYFKDNFKQGPESQQSDKKNMAHKIRQYVRKGFHKQAKRRSYFE